MVKILVLVLGELGSNPAPEVTSGKPPVGPGSRPGEDRAVLDDVGAPFQMWVRPASGLP